MNWPSFLPTRLRFILAVYLVATLAYLTTMGATRLGTHTAYNHFAHLADAWAHGRQDIVHGGPSYAQGNDFAEFGGKTFISFPPFPALLMLPFVALAGSPEDFADGQFIGWLAGVAPAGLFLLLERLRDYGYSTRTTRDNLLLTTAYAFGTVYFFTAVQGTVWFAGHVVGSALLVVFLNGALEASFPIVAGLALGAIWHSRPTMALTGVFFLIELARVHRASFLTRDWRPFVRPLLLISAPVVLALGLATWTNHSRFGSWSPAAFGHEHLAVAWHARMQRWGLFHYHYLAKNLGVMLSSLPWVRARDVTGPFFQINEHGLALWFTTPLYLWLLRPAQTLGPSPGPYRGALLAALGPLAMNLLYQNSGWAQFGYRFSNDYAPLLFVMLALGGIKLGRTVQLAIAWGIAWNSFGALSFDRSDYAGYYFRDGTQEIIYQKD